MNSKNNSWTCIKNCGACCRLAPDERMDSLAALNTEQREAYMKMVGDDGWCRYLDSAKRICRIYDERPDFCKVSNLGSLFNVNQNELDSFAINCCKQQIRSIYGGRSKVLRRFQREVRLKSNKNA